MLTCLRSYCNFFVKKESNGLCVLDPWYPKILHTLLVLVPPENHHRNLVDVFEDVAVPKRRWKPHTLPVQLFHLLLQDPRVAVTVASNWIKGRVTTHLKHSLSLFWTFTMARRFFTFSGSGL